MTLAVFSTVGYIEYSFQTIVSVLPDWMKWALLIPVPVDWQLTLFDSTLLMRSY
jgi:hypothetical protein